MSFGAYYYAEKYKYGAGIVQQFYFGLYKRDECNIFPFLVKKRKRKIIQSILNISTYATKSNG